MLDRLRGLSLLDQAPRALGWQEIVDIADLGLYAAKRGGRNNWVGMEAGDTEKPEGAMQHFRENPEAAVANRTMVMVERGPAKQK